MVCSKCGTLNPEGSRFCTKCFAELVEEYFDVSLISIGANLEGLLSEMREIPGLLIEPERLIELVPCVILKSVNRKVAEDVKSKLESVGASVEINLRVSTKPVSVISANSGESQKKEQIKIDYEEALSFVFKDKRWVQKVLMGGIFAFLGIFIVGWIFIMGYCIKLMRNVIEGEEYPLPEWEGVGEYFSAGLAPFGITIIYSIPYVVFCFLGYIISFIGEMARGKSEGIFPICGVCFMCIGYFLLILTWLIPSAIINYLREGNFGAAFNMGKVWKNISSNYGRYILIILVSWVGQTIGGFSIMLCCIGIVFGFFWAECVRFHLYGQLYRATIIES